MRHLSIIIAALIIATIATFVFSASELPKDGRGTKINACAPSPGNDAVLTGNSQTIDVTGATCWEAYADGGAIKFRTLTSATVTGVQHTIPQGQWFTDPVAGRYTHVQYSTSTGTFRSDKP